MGWTWRAGSDGGLARKHGQALVDHVAVCRGDRRGGCRDRRRRADWPLLSAVVGRIGGPRDAVLDLRLDRDPAYHRPFGLVAELGGHLGRRRAAGRARRGHGGRDGRAERPPRPAGRAVVQRGKLRAGRLRGLSGLPRGRWPFASAGAWRAVVADHERGGHLGGARVMVSPQAVRRRGGGARARQ